MRDLAQDAPPAVRDSVAVQDVCRPPSSIRSTRSIRFLIVSAVFVAAGVGLDSLSAAAAPSEIEPLRVEVTAPASCPAHPTLVDRIRSHTPRVREAKSDESSRALHVVVSPEDERFVADLRLVENGDVLERRVPGKTCEEVLAAVALITALTIDPLATTVPVDAAAPEDAASRAPEAGAETPIVFEVDAGRSPPPRTAVHGSIGASLEAYGLGEMVVGPSLWIEGALARSVSPALRLRVGRTESFMAVRDLRPAYFRLTTVALDGCVTAARSKAELEAPSTFELRPCAQLAGGVLEGASSAFGPLHRIPRPWVSLGAVLQGRWRFFGPLELEAAAGLTLPLVRDNFFFLPRNDVYRAPGVVLVGSVGIGTTFR